MADLSDIGFNADEVEPSTGFELLPAGEYTAMVIDSERKATKAGTGQRLSVTIEIADGQYKGRRLWEGFNIQNPSAEAVAISRAQLSALCRAVGVSGLRDSAQLHNIPFNVELKVKNRMDTGEPKNVIAKYSPRGGSKPSPLAATSESAPWTK